MSGRAGAAARVHCHVASTLALLGWQGGAVQAYRDALRVDPLCPDARFRLGEALARRGRWLEACAAFRESARLRPSSPEIQGNLVLALGRAGRWSEAAEALERLIRLRPGQAELHLLRGAVLRRLGRGEEAIRAFRWAVSLSPSPDWNRFFLGEELLGRRGWAEVLDAFRGALAVREREAEAPGLLAAHESALNRAPARDAEVAPRQPSRRLWRFAFLGLGALAGLAPLLLAPASGSAATRVDSPAAREASRLCIELQKEEGIETCRLALALGLSPPRAAIVNELLAYKLIERNRWDETVAVYRELVRLRPRDPEGHLRLGTALLYGQSNPGEAILAFREALRLRPGDARAHGWIGVALNQLGQLDESVVEFEEALRLDPSYLDNRPGARETYEASRRGEGWP